MRDKAFKLITTGKFFVAVGVIINQNSELLLSYRPKGLPQGGFWEFPGGKVEKGETVFEALRRELREEINIELIDAKPLTQVEYYYKSIQVVLDCWFVEKYCGKLLAKEGQNIQWVHLKDIGRFHFSDPNRLILEHVIKRQKELEYAIQ